MAEQVENEFERKALEAISRVESHQEKILKDTDRLSAETKTALEELTKVKNTCNDIDANYRNLQRVTAALQRERVSNFGDPIKRFCADEANRDWVNAFARKVAWPTVKLPEHLEKALETRAAPMTGVDSSLGSATIPTEVWAQIYDTFSQYGVWPGFDVLRVPARTNTLPLATTAPLYHWIGAGAAIAESVAITESFADGTSVSLTIQTLACLFGVSRELLQDSTADMSAWIMGQMTRAITYGMDFTCLAADATADRADGGYRGIFEMGASNANMIATAAAGNTTTQLTDLDDWERCLTTCNAAVLTRQAKWWMHPHILSKAMLVKDANDRPIFQTALEAPAPGAIGRILGYPVTLADAAPSTNAASAKVAVFGDPMGLAVGVRADMEMAASSDFRFNQNQIVYRALMRAGAVCRQSGTACVPFAILTLPAA